MSVINQMLRDLESRRGDEGANEPLVLSNVPPGGQGHQGRRALWGLFALLLVLAALAAYLFWQRAQTPAASTLAQSAAPARPEAQAENPNKSQAQPQPPQAAPVPPPQASASPAPSVVVKPQVVPREPPARPARPAPLAQAAPPSAVPVKDLAAEEAPSGRIERRLRPLAPAQQAEQHYQAGLRRLQSGQRPQAEQAFRQALESAAAHVPAREAWVGLLLQGGRMVEAEQLLRAGLAAVPGHESFSLLLARVRLQQGDAADAAQVLEAGARGRTPSGEYWATLGGIYQRLQRHAASAEAYRQALARDPGRAVWWMGQGIALEGAGLKPQALVAYNRAEQAGGLSGELLRFVRQRRQQLGPAD